MKPVVALVGRPNVGKSTLFNRLTRSRDAIVVDVPGVTRDRHYGEGRVGPCPSIVIDTGGLEPEAKEGIFAAMAKQVDEAIAEADEVVFVCDGRAGLTPNDRHIAARLRKLKPRIWVAVNKSEGRAQEAAVAEFHELGLGEPVAISAAHGEGVRHLMDEVLAKYEAAAAPAEPAGPKHPRVSIVGRPNVGKSTLVNSLVGEARVLAFDEPGTTRDPIEVPFTRGGKRYTLIDTAGLRKRGKSGAEVERFSIVKTLQAIEESNVSVLVLDATEGISDQDAHVAGYILERGRAVVVAVNKWDAADKEARERIKAELNYKTGFLGFAETLFISAAKGKGLGDVMRAVDKAYAAAFAKLSTPKITRAMIAAIERQSPARRGFSRPKPRYAHQGGMNPPLIVIHGNALENMAEAYKRYLEGVFRKEFGLVGTPLKIELRTSRNPYARDEDGKKGRRR